MKIKGVNMTKDTLHFLFDYREGKLFWKNKTHPKSNRKIGVEAGTWSNGYRVVHIDKNPYYIHKLIYLYHHGYIPEVVNHIDENSGNNKIENLRPATFAQATQSSPKRARNKLGIKNVHFNEKSKRYHVSIRANKKDIFIGSYENLDSANSAAINARNKYHGNFANHK
jgi:hypothetical protein